MDRVILHCDCNSFYASVETALNPALAAGPMAVCGNPENRHGVILAKNELAKKKGVLTAETVWQARRKCPELLLVPPHHEEYARMSRKVNALYGQYTDQVEPFGIDESWLDVTGSRRLFGGGEEIAGQLRRRVKEELGLTISVGDSFNKVFAKLGSDYKKPDATTVVSRENFRRLLWPLPVSALLYVGDAARDKLAAMSIFTIGQLAAADRRQLSDKLGKLGGQLFDYANGLDDSPVAAAEEQREIKSVGNSMTFRRDLVGEEDARLGLLALTDTVAGRLRAHGLRCTVVQITVKNPQFQTITRQRSLPRASWLSRELFEAGWELLELHWRAGAPIRMLGVTGLGLVPEGEATEQLSLFEEEGAREKRGRLERLERAVDQLRGRFGGEAVVSGALLDNELGLGPGHKPHE